MINTSNSTVLLVIAVCLLMQGVDQPMASDQQDGKKPKPVEMSVSIVNRGRVDSEYTLNVKLTNKMPKPLTVYEHSLPWRGWNSILLIAVKTDAVGSVIDRPQLIDDPGPQKITIKPGETVEGKIALTKRFPGLADALKQRDVLIFWSYQPQPVDTDSLERFAGWLLLPKGGKPEGKKGRS